MYESADNIAKHHHHQSLESGGCIAVSLLYYVANVGSSNGSKGHFMDILRLDSHLFICIHCKGNPLMPCLSVSDSASAPDASSGFRCIFCLPMCLLPPDASSAFRCVFRFTTHLPPPDLSPAPPPTMVPSSACLLTASSGCRDFHHHPATFCNVSPCPLSIPLGIRCTATSSTVPLHVPAAPLSQPTARCRMMSHDAVPPTRYRLRPATVSDPLPPPTCHLARPAFRLYHAGALRGIVPYTYLLISDLFSISVILYIRPCLQADSYPFLFGSPARCVSCLD